MAPASAYDIVAPSFDLHRTLPDRTVEVIRTALLNAINPSPSPRLLDLGAGTGRIGRAFVAAEDDYVGVDLSFGMLREFVRRAGPRERPAPQLVQADGERLPFRDASFDVVMMMQVLGAARRWRPLASEALRVLRSPGTLVIGHSVMPPDGLDARMKRRLALLLAEMGAPSYHNDARDEVIDWLGSVAASSSRVVAAEWDSVRTPMAFLERQRSGAQFSKLPEAIKDDALRDLNAWAAATFGSLDAAFTEKHAFELLVFRFHDGGGCGHAGEDR